MAGETINFALTVNPATSAFTVVDADGNPLSDGADVTLKDETVGVADEQTLLTVSGGTPPYNFSVASGALPDGDSLSSTENADGSETVTLEGTPTAAGAADFSLAVSDSAGNSVTLNAKKKIS